MNSQDAMFLHPLNGFAMPDNSLLAQRIVALRRPRHELDALLRDRIRSRVNVPCPNGDVLNALALVLLKVIHNLPGFAAILVDRNPDTPARRSQRAREQPGELALNVEEPDFLEIEKLAIASL